MSILDAIADIFGGSNRVFAKLTPEYFEQQKAKMRTEEYAHWLQKRMAFYSSIAYENKATYGSVPENWVNGIRLIESEIEKINTQGTSHLFSVKTTNASEDLIK